MKNNVTLETRKSIDLKTSILTQSLSTGVQNDMHLSGAAIFKKAQKALQKMSRADNHYKFQPYDSTHIFTQHPKNQQPFLMKKPK